MVNHNRNLSLIPDQELEVLNNKKFEYITLKITTKLNTDDIQILMRLETIDEIAKTVLAMQPELFIDEDHFLDVFLNNLELIKEIQKKGPKVILFDCDGTLVQTESINKLTFKEILKPNKEKFNINQIQQIYKQEVLSALTQINRQSDLREVFEEIFHEEISELINTYTNEPEKIIAQTLLEENKEIEEEKKLLFVSLMLSTMIKGLTFNTAFNTILSIKLPGQFEDISEFRQNFRAHNIKIKETHGVDPTLGTRDFIKNTTIPYIVASNSPNKVIKENTEALNIQEERILSSHDLPEKRGKPFPDVFIKALRILNTESNDSVIIEDSKPGVLAGLSAGISKTLYSSINKNLLELINKLEISELDRKLMEVRLQKEIWETIMRKQTQEIIIDNLGYVLFRPIDLIGAKLTNSAFKFVFKKLEESDFKELLNTKIKMIFEEIDLDENIEIIEDHATELLEKSFQNIDKKALKEKPTIIIFNNGDNQTLSCHPEFLSITDMRDLDLLLNFDSFSLPTERKEIH